MSYGALDEEFNGEIYAKEKLFVHDTIRTKQNSNSLLQRTKSALYNAIIIAVICMLLVSIVYRAVISRFFAPDVSVDFTLSIVVTNEYTSVNSKSTNYDFMDNTVFMEPWRENVIIVDELMSTCSNSWSLQGINTLSDERLSGTVSSSNTFVVVPKSTGYYTLSILSVCNGKSQKFSQSVVVKYVRRDLTTLTDSDREEFLSAFYTLWTVDTLTGQKIYGDKYKSLYYFATIYNDGVANPVCDEFHGSGYLNNIVALSAYLEQSLQLVNPRTALHYWEYSRDFSSDSYSAHVLDQLDGGAWTEIMTDTYFGTSDPISGAILDSRWAYALMPRVTLEFMTQHNISATSTFFSHEEVQWLQLSSPPHITSPYGFLRGPWDYATRNYTTRYNNAMRIASSNGLTTFAYNGVACDTYQQFIAKSVTDKSYMTYMSSVYDEIVSIVESTVGGVGGDRAVKIDKTLRSDYGLTDDDIAVIASRSSQYNKAFQSLANTSSAFPSAAYPNPVSCNDVTPWNTTTYSLSTTIAPGKDGGPLCTVHDFYLSNETNADYLVQKLFESTTTTASTGGSSTDVSALHVWSVYTALSFEQKVSFMDLVFSRMQVDGDLASSGAAIDPLFWVTNSAVERLHHRVMTTKNVFSGDREYVASGSNRQCQGHNEDSSVDWLEGFSFEDNSIVAEDVTQKQLSTILDPSSASYASYMTYVYDNLEYSHCDGSELWFSRR